MLIFFTNNGIDVRLDSMFPVFYKKNSRLIGVKNKVISVVFDKKNRRQIDSYGEQQVFVD